MMKSYLILLLSVLSLLLLHQNRVKSDLLTQQQVAVSSFMATQEYCIDLAVHHEARGEPEIGQYLVARTIINRAVNAGTTPCDEVFKPYQYSFANSVTHYHTKQVKPSWSKSFKKVAVIGGHVFYTTKK